MIISINIINNTFHNNNLQSFRVLLRLRFIKLFVIRRFSNKVMTSSISRQLAHQSVSRSRTGAMSRMSLSSNKKVQLELTDNHPLLIDPVVYQMNQKRADIIGSMKKIDFAAQPKYKNIANPEAINQQIQAVLGNPNSELISSIASAVYEQQNQMRRKLPKNQRTMIDSGRQLGYNNVSNIEPIMPNCPMGLPIAQSYQMTPDEQALLQMQDPNPPTHFAETGGMSTMAMCTPPAWYKEDMISKQRARQGGLSYNRQTPIGSGNQPETQIRHNPAAPAPQITYMPSLNLVNAGDRTTLNRKGII